MRFRALASLALVLGACGGNDTDGNVVGAETALPRETRSETFCARLANDGGAYDVDRALLCRREEGAAAARAGLLEIPDDLDTECGDMASGGPQLRDFSWVAYMECVGPRLP
jgi:hypothetical protein